MAMKKTAAEDGPDAAEMQLAERATIQESMSFTAQATCLAD